jgi:hypothetical protein
MFTRCIPLLGRIIKKLLGSLPRVKNTKATPGNRFWVAF